MTKSNSKPTQNCELQHENYVLKPCPFCGGKAEFITIHNKSNHTSVGFNYTIACSSCSCTPIRLAGEMNVFLDKDGEVKITEASAIKKQNMIAKWNTRTQNDDKG